MARQRNDEDLEGNDLKNLGGIPSLKDFLGQENFAQIFKAFLRELPGWSDTEDVVLRGDFTWAPRGSETPPPAGTEVDAYADDYADEYTETI